MHTREFAETTMATKALDPAAGWIVGVVGPLQLDVLLPGLLEAIDAHDHALARLDLLLVAERRLLDLALDEALLDRGDRATHDRLVAEASRDLRHCDLIALAQYSMAPVADEVAEATGRPVLTTPDSAVLKLKKMLGVAPD